MPIHFDRSGAHFDNRGTHCGFQIPVHFDNKADDVGNHVHDRGTHFGSQLPVLFDNKDNHFDRSTNILSDHNASQSVDFGTRAGSQMPMLETHAGWNQRIEHGVESGLTKRGRERAVSRERERES